MSGSSTFHAKDYVNEHRVLDNAAIGHGDKTCDFFASLEVQSPLDGNWRMARLHRHKKNRSTVVAFAGPCGDEFLGLDGSWLVNDEGLLMNGDGKEVRVRWVGNPECVYVAVGQKMLELDAAVPTDAAKLLRALKRYGLKTTGAKQAKTQRLCRLIGNQGQRTGSDDAGFHIGFTVDD